MKRKYRVTATAVAAAGLVTGAAAAFAAVPNPAPPITPSRVPVSADSVAARSGELARLQAELVGSRGRGTRLQAQIARLQNEIERARATATASAPPPSGSVAASPTAVPARATRRAQPSASLTPARTAPPSAPRTPTTPPSVPPTPSTTGTTGDDGLGGGLDG